jgi:hypothetical protein
MRTLPETMIRVLSPFAPLFSRRVWQHVRLLLVGAILAPGKRTVASTLRAERSAFTANDDSAATIGL